MLTCAGLSLVFLIGTLTMWGGMPITELTGLPIAEVVKYWTVALQVTLSFTLFAIILINKVQDSTVQQTVAFAGGFLFVLGCVALFFSSTSFWLVFSGVAVGAGQGLLMLLWQQRLALLEKGAVIKVPILALAAAAMAYLIMFSLPKILLFYITVLAGLASAVLLIVSAPTFTHSLSKEVSLYKKLDNAEAAQALKNPICCIVSMAAVVLLTRFVALGTSDDPNTVNVSANICILVMAAMVYLALFGFFKDKVYRGAQVIQLVYYLAFPVIATALLLLLLSGAMFSTVVAALAYAVFATIFATIMSTSVDIAQEHKAAPEQIYGVLAGSMYLACTIVTLLGSTWLFKLDVSTDKSIAIVCVLTLYILALSLFVLHGYFGLKRDPEHVSSVPATSELILGEAFSKNDSVAMSCARIGVEYDLTSRERDILFLILKGRDAPGIASNLHISINTVRSHSKSIYRKLDIHSKQQLLDMIEHPQR